jgi:hypothetical protein
MHSLTSALDGGEWSASRTSRFTLGERFAVPIRQEAGWAPTAGLDAVENKKIPNPRWESNPQTPIVKPIIIIIIIIVVVVVVVIIIDYVFAALT